MQDLSETFAPSKATAQPAREPSSLSVMLQCGPDGVEIQSVEFSSGEVITRCAFRERRHPSQVLVARLAAVVEALALEVGDAVGITSKPEFSLALPGIVVTRARIMVSRARGTARYVQVRFRQCFGNVVSVFTEGTRPWRMGHDQSAQVAAETMEKVFIPLQNFAAYVDSLPAPRSRDATPLEESLRATRRRIDELELYYHMLSEFLLAQERQSARRSASVVARLAASSGPVAG